MDSNRNTDGGVFVTVSKDARDAGISRYYGHRLAAEGKIPMVKFGTREHTIAGSTKAYVDGSWESGDRLMNAPVPDLEPLPRFCQRVGQSRNTIRKLMDQGRLDS
jgi:hypothetical protein